MKPRRLRWGWCWTFWNCEEEDEACTDNNDNCAQWVSSGYCRSSSPYHDYMQENCCGSCDSDDSGQSDDTCERDLSEQCVDWAQAGYCQTSSQYHDYMKQNCCKSCDSGGSGEPDDGGSSEGHCKPVSVSASKDRALNIVLVPSAFNGNRALWREKTKWITDYFSQYKPLDAANIPGLNIWYVDVDMSGDDGRQCYFGCHNIPRLLCCPGRYRFIQHARTHCGSGFIMNTLIIHNSDRYGGAGYTSDNAATCSINPAAPQVAAHELGHSLFGLADEYTYGSGTAGRDPNCDVAGCPKWADLNGRWGVGCLRSKCKGGNYYASDYSLMDSLSGSFGAVNERITCCKYMYHFGNAPAYCDKFSEGTLNLNTYCAGSLWRGQFTNLDTFVPDKNSSVPEEIQILEAHRKKVSRDEQGTGYTYLKNPVEWIIGRPGLDKSWVCMRSLNTLQPGVYLREQVYGNSDSATNAEHSVKVYVMKKKEIVREVSFSDESRVEIPPEFENATDKTDFLEQRPSIRIILNEGEYCDVRRVGEGDLQTPPPPASIVDRIVAVSAASHILMTRGMLILLACAATTLRHM